MKTLISILACPVVLVPLLSGCAAAIASSGEPTSNREALVCEVGGHVKVLVFNTDRPVQQLRLIIDGKEVASDSFHSTANGLKLAVVTPPHSQEPIVEFHFEVDNMGGYMRGAFREERESNVAETEYFGPGRNLILNGWTEIYGYSQHYSGTSNTLYDLRFEIK